MPEIAEQIHDFLEKKSAAEPELQKLISDGFYLIKHPVDQKLLVQ
jgi:phenylalanine-4-hydroxylase